VVPFTAQRSRVEARAARGFATILLLLAGCSRAELTAPDTFHPCVALDPDGLSRREISTRVNIDRSDIVLLVDTSSSMADEIERIRNQLVDVLVPEIYKRVSDARLGVAVFSDFGERQLGERSHPYQLMLPMTDDIGRVLDATRRIQLEYGGDTPESQLEALYQVATGDGLGVYVDEGPKCAEGGRGGVCFRSGSFANVMLFTDAPMRGVVGLQPDGSLSWFETLDLGMEAPFIPYQRKYEETIDALRAENIRVLGLWSGQGEGLDDMRRVARDTGAVDAAGEPIVLDIGSEGQALGTGIVQALESLSSGARLEVAMEMYDANLGDGLDPRALVTEVRALRAEPADGAVPAGDHFEQVRTGTRVYFEIVFDGSRLPSAAFERRFPMGLQVRADDGSLLSEQTVDLIVLPDGQCAPLDSL
jgi:hypothetical protein